MGQGSQLNYSGRDIEDGETEGFPLTELLIVVTITLNIAAIAIPNLLPARIENPSHSNFEETLILGGPVFAG